MRVLLNFFTIFIFLWIFELSNRSFHCYRFAPNTFTFNSYSECPGDEENVVHVDYSIAPISRNKFVINGEAVFLEVLGGKMEVNEIGANFLEQPFQLFKFYVLDSSDRRAMRYQYDCMFDFR